VASTFPSYLILAIAVITVVAIGVSGIVFLLARRKQPNS